jgi:hypothetical protein
MISDTNDVTTLEKAAPMIKPRATSMTLSRPRKAVQERLISSTESDYWGSEHTCKVFVEPRRSSDYAILRLNQGFLDVIDKIVHVVTRIALV